MSKEDDALLPSGRGLCSPPDRRTPTSVSRGKRREARSCVMSSLVTLEPIQEPDGSAMDRSGRKKDDGEELYSGLRAQLCVGGKEQSESGGTGGRE